MLNVLGDDYIRTARAKGVTRRTLLVKHALRNALIPVVSVTSLYTIILMGSSVMIEIVFSRPGLGKLLLQAVEQRDYITLESLIILYSAFAIVINIVTDIFYAWIDPSISYS
jgi:ABC-type dipeptide/oligopeptide/nickel transport system permease component